MEQYRSLSNFLVKEKYYRFSLESSKVYECSTTYETSNCIGGTKHKSCRENSEGPLCSLCVKGFFHRSDGGCQPCEESNVLASVAPMIAFAAFLFAIGLLLQLHFAQQYRRRVVAWALEHRLTIDWTIISLRLMFFDYQVSLQEV